jgi:DNA-binding CsgD family transcriptional regulator
MTSTAPIAAKRRPKLTPREREVLALIACGYSTSEIARVLWITEDTVRTHVKRLLARLPARTRAHAVAIAFREGLWKKEGPEEGEDV